MTPGNGQTARAHRQLQVTLTRDPAWIREAQKLRYQVFSQAYGADMGAAETGIDADHFDAFCDHLLVIDAQNGQLVATTRILNSDDAILAGSFYSENEFDITSLKQLPGRVAEIGRTCVHPDYQNGGSIGVLWSGIGAYLREHDIQFMIGCASLSMSDGGLKAWRIACHLQKNHPVEEHWQTTPRRTLPHLTSMEDDSIIPPEIPALIKAYIRLGARVCGAPCWDPLFRCADLLVLIDVAQMNNRYARHFLRQEPHRHTGATFA